MKLLVIWVFCFTPLIRGAPNDYEQWLQPRGLGDLISSGVSWIFKSDSSVKNDNVTDSQDHSTNEDLQISDDQLDEMIYSTHSPNTETHQKESQYQNDDNIKTLQQTPSVKQFEPVEDIMIEIEKEIESVKSKEDQKDYLATLTNLKEKLNNSPETYTEVVMKNIKHFVDIGRLGSERRTKAVQQINILEIPLLIILGLLSQVVNVITYIIPWLSGNKQQSLGSNYSLLPQVFSHFNGSPGQQTHLGGAIGMPKNGEQSINLNGVKYPIAIFCLTGNGSFSEEKPKSSLISDIRDMLSKKDLTMPQKWDIILKLFELYKDPNVDPDTKLSIFDIIFMINKDDRFKKIFDMMKKREQDNPEYKNIWILFKESEDKLNELYKQSPNLAKKKESDPKTSEKHEKDDPKQETELLQGASNPGAGVYPKDPTAKKKLETKISNISYPKPQTSVNVIKSGETPKNHSGELDPLQSGLDPSSDPSQASESSTRERTSSPKSAHSEKGISDPSSKKMSHLPADTPSHKAPSQASKSPTIKRTSHKAHNPPNPKALDPSLHSESKFSQQQASNPSLKVSEPSTEEPNPLLGEVDPSSERSNPPLEEVDPSLEGTNPLSEEVDPSLVGSDPSSQFPHTEFAEGFNPQLHGEPPETINTGHHVGHEQFDPENQGNEFGDPENSIEAQDAEYSIQISYPYKTPEERTIIIWDPTNEDFFSKDKVPLKNILEFMKTSAANEKDQNVLLALLVDLYLLHPAANHKEPTREVFNDIIQTLMKRPDKVIENIYNKLQKERPNEFSEYEPMFSMFQEQDNRNKNHGHYEEYDLPERMEDGKRITGKIYRYSYGSSGSPLTPEQQEELFKNALQTHKMPEAFVPKQKDSVSPLSKEDEAKQERLRKQQHAESVINNMSLLEKVNLVRKYENLAKFSLKPVSESYKKEKDEIFELMDNRGSALDLLENYLLSRVRNGSVEDAFNKFHNYLKDNETSFSITTKDPQQQKYIIEKFLKEGPLNSTLKNP